MESYAHFEVQRHKLSGVLATRGKALETNCTPTRGKFKSVLQIRYSKRRIIKLTLPVAAKDLFLEDAIQRDITTARRVALLEILWNERYLTRAQFIARVELRLGRGRFGSSARQDTFYRDMCVVKKALDIAGYPLLYSRNKRQTGYYLHGQPTLSSEFKQILKASVAEVDQRQIDIYLRLSSADRFHQGCSISDTARNVAAYRIRQENPKLSIFEANRLVLEQAYHR